MAAFMLHWQSYIVETETRYCEELAAGHAFEVLQKLFSALISIVCFPVLAIRDGQSYFILSLKALLWFPRCLKLMAKQNAQVDVQLHHLGTAQQVGFPFASWEKFSS